MLLMCNMSDQNLNVTYCVLCYLHLSQSFKKNLSLVSRSRLCPSWSCRLFQRVTSSFRLVSLWLKEFFMFPVWDSVFLLHTGSRSSQIQGKYFKEGIILNLVHTYNGTKKTPFSRWHEQMAFCLCFPPFLNFSCLTSTCSSSHGCY